MPGARVTFGKRNAMPASQPEIAPSLRSAWLTWSVGGAIALIIASAGLTLFPWESAETQVISPSGTNLADSGTFALNGIWAPKDRSCDETNSYVEFKDGLASAVGSIGRIEAFRYTVSGGNPLRMTTADGASVLWDTSNPEILLPISVQPDKPGRAKSMTFRRCSEADI